MTDALPIAFLGLGRMGSAMAGHVARAGHRLTVWNRTPDRAGPLLALGAAQAGTVAEAVAGAEVVVLMLFGPEAVRSVLAEVMAAARPGTLVVDGSTIGPQAAREFDQACRAAGLRYLDAPVTGSVGPAREGRLGVLVGAGPADFAEAEPLLHLWGEPDRVRLLGPVGAGNAAKLMVNLTIGVAMAGVGDALRLAADLGVDTGVALDLLGQGPLGWTVAQKRPMLATGLAEPAAFSLDALAKDLALAAGSVPHRLPAVEAALEGARQAARAGLGAQDYTAMAVHRAADGSPR